MVELLFDLPALAGGIVTMAVSTTLGLMVYIGAHSLIARYKTEDLNDSTSSLSRVIGMLVGLMLSLALAEVLVQLRAIENAIEREAVAVSDIIDDLQRFGGPEARRPQSMPMDYARAIVDDDWPALAGVKLGRQADASNRQLQRAALEL